ncbi:hypothetical protein AAE478_009471 [Parahypoxylon ruwenzoriense]
MNAAKHSTGGGSTTNKFITLSGGKKTASSTSPFAYRLLLPPDTSSTPDSDPVPGGAAGEDGARRNITAGKDASPLVICFHGSGESSSPSWDALAGIIAGELGARVLLQERDPVVNPAPARAAADLRACLKRERERLRGPYVLVAHSYGGAFARAFLERVGTTGKKSEEGEMVVGMVLAETGQEGGLDREAEERQYVHRVLGSRPLSVVRGNSLIGMWKGLEAAKEEALERSQSQSQGQGQGQGDGSSVSATAGDDEAQRKREEDLRQRRQMLTLWDEEDERLKKRQLGLSREGARKRYVHVPDCGHHLVRDRPDVLAAEVGWVMGRGVGAGGGGIGGEGIAEEEGEEQEESGKERKRGCRGFGEV